MDVRQYLDYLREQQGAMVDELGRYVTIESGSREKDGVDRVGREVSKALTELGFSIERIESETCGDHLVARRPGAGRGRLLALIHLDTTCPSGSLADNPFRVEDGRAFGPGTRDMKGGWVVLLGALRALQHEGWDGLAQTTIFLTGDEELGSVSGRPWIEKEGRQADWAVVMEPARPGGNLVGSRGMVGAVSFEVRGAAAHNSDRGRGASAIVEAAHKVLALEALNAVERGVLVNVGLLQGGTARQILPDRAYLSIDLRAPNAAEAETLVQQVRAIAAQSTVPGTSTMMSGGITRPALEVSPRLLRLAQQVGRQLGLTLEGIHTRGGSDGSFTAAVGVPTLDGLGPESGGGIGRTENILVESLPQRAALLAGIIHGLPDLLDEG